MMPLVKGSQNSCTPGVEQGVGFQSEAEGRKRESETGDNRLRGMSSGQQQRYDLVAQYDGLVGMVQDEGTRVVNMFRYYEEEDPRYCTPTCKTTAFNSLADCSPLALYTSTVDNLCDPLSKYSSH